MQQFTVSLIVQTNTRTLGNNDIEARLDPTIIANLEKIFTGQVLVQKVSEFQFIIGGLLPNGATLLAIKPHLDGVNYVVYAKRSFGYSPYVTWVADKHGNCEHGHYYNEPEAALAGFHQRGTGGQVFAGAAL